MIGNQVKKKMVRPNNRASHQKKEKITSHMIAALTFFPQDSDLSYGLTPQKRWELNQKLKGNKNALILYEQIQIYASSGHNFFMFSIEEMMEELQMSRHALRKAMTDLEQIFEFKFEPIHRWQLKLPDSELSAPPTPRRGKLVKRRLSAKSTPPAPAVESPQPEVATISDAPAQAELAAENTAPAPAVESPQPELATMSDAPHPQIRGCTGRRLVV